MAHIALKKFADIFLLCLEDVEKVDAHSKYRQ
jgi:hypothetical protein